MPNITAPTLTFPAKSFPAQQAGAPAGVIGDMLYSELMPRYATLVKSQKVFYTSAIITAPVIFSTAGQLGPMLWNRPSSGIDAHVLAISISPPTTATTVAGSIGWAASPQTTAPTTPTAITAVNAYAGGGTSSMGAVNSTGTVLVLPVPIFLPLVAVNTGAVTITTLGANWFDVGGGLILPPGTVGYVCSSATLTAGVFTIAIVWAELPT